MKLTIKHIVLFLALSATVQAGVVVPNGYDTTSGNFFQQGILGNGATKAYTFQVGYAASQLSDIAAGSLITGFGIRLPSRAATLTDDLSFTDYTIEVGQAAVPTEDFGVKFADNVINGLTVRTGAMTIAGGSILGGQKVNPFFVIDFTTPYTYQGGGLVITLRHTALASVDTKVDAVTGYSTAVVNTVGFFRSATATEGVVGFYAAPILDLQFVPPPPVPEPSSLVLAGIGLAVTAGMRWRRRRRTT